MDAIVRSHVQLMSLNVALIHRAVEGLTPDELARSPDTGNPMIWLVGHLTTTRLGLMEMFGGTRTSAPWTALFARGRKRATDDTYPPVADLLATLDATVVALTPLLESMTEDRWMAPSPRSLPVEDKSIRGALAFFTFHETYHVGQLAYLRTWLGHSALVG